MERDSDAFSSSSAAAAPSSSSSAPRPPLPVMALRGKIVEKIQENRVTLIVGDTGCELPDLFPESLFEIIPKMWKNPLCKGKSSQVPQFLLEANMEPILCTQPRRFAAVAVARMVAAARNSEIGGEVGYHIGHSNVSDMTEKKSKIVFKTAGVLLEQMRDKGMAALNYKAIILDEVHERSVESDLVLACVKQFMMKNNDLRVVLMSATADIARYRDYFRDLGRGERVEVIAIPTASQESIFQRKVLYLEQVADLLGLRSESLSVQYCSGPSPSDDADMKPEVHTLIHNLILHIDKNEPDIEKSILIFLPTYYALEQQWNFLRPLNMHFKVHILHRSIDTDQALMAMRIWKCHRKVILATNIAESSVTIPGVAFVIDSCRSLQIYWDSNRKRDSAELIWVSKSQADQRKGRTGRTCDGQIYRLVTREFYNKLNDHEYPAILRLSLRQQVLMLCCSESKAINDPKVLLQRVLDPPNPDIVEDALGLLVHIHALERPLTQRGRYEPTFYGRLVDSLPLSFDSSMLVIKFGKIGLLREGIIISVLMDIQPLPILQPFGQLSLFTKYVDNYFAGDTANLLQTGRKEHVFMANLCAYQFWQRAFKDKHRLEHLKEIVKVEEPKASQSLMSKLEEEWCLVHNLERTPLHNVSEIYEDILSSMHCFRPEFFATSNLPSYYEPYAYKHACVVQTDLQDDMDALKLDDDSSTSERRKCVATPFVGSKDFQAITVAEKMATLIKEIRLQHLEDTSLNHDGRVNNTSSPSIDVALCKFFVKGSCNKGNNCGYSHSVQAKRPMCKFFLTYQGCRNGDACYFMHDSSPCVSSTSLSTVCLREDGFAKDGSFLQLLPTTTDGCILILNDRNLYFSSNLSYIYDPMKIIATTPYPYSPGFDASSNGSTVMWNVRKPYHSIIDTREFDIPWERVRCVLWFGEDEAGDASIQQEELQNFFEFLAIRLLADTLYNLRLIITMNNIKFAQLQVERLARECFFFLIQSFPFDDSTFGKLSERSSTSRPMQASLPVSYVFHMHPPSDIEFGDYAAVLQKGMYSNW